MASLRVCIKYILCVAVNPLYSGDLRTRRSWSDYRGGQNRQVHSNMWVTSGTRQDGQFGQCGRLTEARIREVSLCVR